MSKMAEWFIMGFFATIGLAIIFVKAGQKGGATGGQQTAQILSAGGESLANVASSIEGF